MNRKWLAAPYLVWMVIFGSAGNDFLLCFYGKRCGRIKIYF